MIIQLLTLKNNVKLFLFFILLVNAAVYAQCNTAGFTVTKTAGTCLSNSSITINVPSSTNCNGWVAKIIKLPSGTPIQQNVPTNGGEIVFNALEAGDYNVTLSDGSSTVPFTSNPVVLTNSYQNISLSNTRQAPSCPNASANYSPDGTLSATVATDTGTPPFTYKLTTTLGTQTFGPVTSRTQLFTGLPGGETAMLTVVDACGFSVNQSPALPSNTTASIGFNSRPFNYTKDCSNAPSSCTNIRVAAVLINSTADKTAVLDQAGNAMITFGGNTYNLRRDITSAVNNPIFYYDPVFASGPIITDGTTFTVNFFDGCFNLSRNGIVDCNNYFNIGTSTIADNATCSIKYGLRMLAWKDATYLGNTDQDRSVHWCPNNKIKVEYSTIFAGPYTDITSTGVLDASGSPPSGINDLGVNLAALIPTGEKTWFVKQTGFYRVTVTDACQTKVFGPFNLGTTNPFTAVTAKEVNGVLAGTSAIDVTFGGNPFSSTVQVEITRADGQTSMAINPSQPYSLAGAYTVNFPIVRSYSYVPAFAKVVVSDLPLGQYNIRITDGCSSSTGLFIDRIVNLVSPAQYNPVVNVVTGCSNSSTINYNMNPVNVENTQNFVQLYLNNGSGGLGSLVATSPSTSLSGSFSNLPAADYIIRFSSIDNLVTFSGYASSPALGSNAPWEYSAPVSIEPFNNNLQVSLSSILCDVNNANSGIISAQVTGGTIVYPLTFSLFSASNSTVPISGPHTVTSPNTSFVFNNVSSGSYFVRTSTACNSVDNNIDFSTVSVLPTAEVVNQVVCPNSP